VKLGLLLYFPDLFFQNRKETDVHRIPVSNHFTPPFAIKESETRPKTPKVTEPTPSATASDSNGLVQMLMVQNTTLLSILTRGTAPSLNLRNDSTPKACGTPLNSHRQIDSSPPPPYVGPLETWGKANNLREETIEALDRLGFSPGDDLLKMAQDYPAEYEKAKIPVFEWQRAVQASRSYRKKSKQAAQNEEEGN
jgi:hypothetical protein